jgi:hypothetical protein
MPASDWDGQVTDGEGAGNGEGDEQGVIEQAFGEDCPDGKQECEVRGGEFARHG